MLIPKTNQTNIHILKDWGIEIIEEKDDLFFEVNLPSGWKLEVYEKKEDSNKSSLIDERGFKRANLIIKHDLYGRRSKINILSRFVITKIEDRVGILYKVDDIALEKTILKTSEGKYARFKKNSDKVGFLFEDVFYYNSFDLCFKDNIRGAILEFLTEEDILQNYVYVGLCDYSIIRASDALVYKTAEKQLKSMLIGVDPKFENHNVWSQEFDF